MTFSISLNFEGNCKEALDFYAKVFGSTPLNVLTYGEMSTSFDDNVRMSEKGKSLIANAQLLIADTIVTFSDMPDNFEFIRGNNLALCVSFDTFDKAESIFNSLVEGGSVFVPLIKETQTYSLFSDRFNVTWNISVVPNV